TMIIGFAFFGILLLWQVYDSWCPKFLEQLFMEALHKQNNEEVQYLVGIMMALDNLAALILMPIFGRLSDKTRTKLGKRMPYILIGTFVCAVSFPFIPVFFHYHQIGGVITMMAIVVCFAMMYRNPAVALMPDLTPKPLRSKANGIINIMGYLGGAFASVAGVVFVLSDYLGSTNNGWKNGTSNIWLIEAPFLIASVLMVISAVVLAFTVRENELEAKLAEEIAEGERQAAVVDSVEHDDEKPMSKANLVMLLLILAAEFFWFMSDNGIGTFMLNYSTNFLGAKTSSNLIMVIIGGVGSVVGFSIGGFIAQKIGRKWTVVSGLLVTLISLIAWALFQNTMPLGAMDAEGFRAFPWYLYLVWGLKGFGMSLVHLNSFPMVVELCSKKKVGQFTGDY
ncbi:MAG: MFS transporter, partial [Candidatus Enteromonas sp.]|nr:MFS transporter [Candidatus Enteromonas sp.]